MVPNTILNGKEKLGLTSRHMIWHAPFLVEDYLVQKVKINFKKLLALLAKKGWI